MKYNPGPLQPHSLLTSSFIRNHIPMTRAIDLMEIAFRILSEKSATVPKRIVMSTPDNAMSVFFKPAFLSQYNRMSVKMLTQILTNEDPEIPTIKGIVLLIDMKNGQIISISDGTSITALRTGAASGIATKYLAKPDASSLAIFGCGAQGNSQLDAVMAVRPIREVSLFDINEKRAETLMKSSGLSDTVRFTINPPLAMLKSADIICTATNSQKPLFTLKDVKPGVHINAIGSYRPDMQEIDPGIFRCALTYLDDAPACIKDSGDLIKSLDSGHICETDIQGELGELIAGNIGGRQHADDITIFKSVGNAIQDFFIANEAYERSMGSEDTKYFDFDA